MGSRKRAIGMLVMGGVLLGASGQAWYAQHDYRDLHRPVAQAVLGDALPSGAHGAVAEVSRTPRLLTPAEAEAWREVHAGLTIRYTVCGPRQFWVTSGDAIPDVASDQQGYEAPDCVMYTVLPHPQP